MAGCSEAPLKRRAGAPAQEAGAGGTCLVQRDDGDPAPQSTPVQQGLGRLVRVHHHLHPHHRQTGSPVGFTSREEAWQSASKSSAPGGRGTSARPRGAARASSRPAHLVELAGGGHLQCGRGHGVPDVDQARHHSLDLGPVKPGLWVPELEVQSCTGKGGRPGRILFRLRVPAACSGYACELAGRGQAGPLGWRARVAQVSTAGAALHWTDGRRAARSAPAS